MNAVKPAVQAAELPLTGRRSSGARVPVLFTLGAGIALFLIVGLFHIWSRVAIVEQGYAIGRQRAHRDELLQERKSLELDLARLREPVRLERAAQGLGLAAPTPGQIVIMEVR